jgi:hypothetical protein
MGSSGPVLGHNALQGLVPAGFRLVGTQSLQMANLGRDVA